MTTSTTSLEAEAEALAVPETPVPIRRSWDWLRETLAADREMFRFTRVRRGLFKYIYYPDFTVVAIFRLAHYCHGRRRTRPFAYLLTMLNDYVFGVYLPPGIRIGPGLVMAHPRGTMIHATAEIGSGFSILQQCIIGGPNVKIGDRVSFSACSKAFSNVRGSGSLTIGDEAIIGAASTVFGDVPPRTIVVGSPAKPLREIEPEENWVAFHAKRYGLEIPEFLRE